MDVEIELFDDPLSPRGWGAQPALRALRVALDPDGAGGGDASVGGEAVPGGRDDASGEAEGPAPTWRLRPTVLVRDWDRYDGPETFWYFDPPYVGNEHEYLGEFSHEVFVATVADLEGDWMVSYRELPDGLRDLADTVETFQATDRADGAKKATERLVLNYDPETVTALTDSNQRTLEEIA